MSLLDRIFKIYSIGFISMLCLFFLGVGLVARLSGAALDLPMLPWSGGPLMDWILALSLIGLAAAALAVGENARWLLAIFAIYVFCQMTYGFYAGPHRFDGYDDFERTAVWTILALIAAGAAVRNAWRRRA